jgi:hypothetical protein
MSNNKTGQNANNIFNQQPKHRSEGRPHGGVRQDKRFAESARAASQQASRSATGQRAHPMKNESVRSPLANTGSHKKVKITLWVNPVVKAILERLATRNRLSLSATAGALLERAVQQNIDMEYGALLESVIQSAVSRHMRAFASRIALLQVRIAFSAEQTRSILSEVLRRQPGVTEEVREQILDWSANLARNKITARTPQLQSVIDQVKQWFTEELDGEER